MTSRDNHFEQVACEFLQSKGLYIFARNFFWAGGEIDIVALDGRELVFVEVKYRDSDQFGDALESITQKQIKRIHRTAEVFLEKTPEFTHHFYRFDAIGISPIDSCFAFPKLASLQPQTFQQYYIEWIPNSF